MKIVTKLAVNHLLKLDRYELTDIVKDIIEQRDLIVSEIPEPEDVLFNYGVKRINEIEASKIKVIDKDTDTYKLESLRKTSCEGCIFLHQENVYDDGDLYFKYGCLLYNTIINEHAGSLPLCAQHLPICKCRYPNKNNKRDIIPFEK